MSCPDPLYDYEDFDDMTKDSDDGYDAARDAYNMGYGAPVTRRQRQEEQDWNDECHRNGW